MRFPHTNNEQVCAVVGCARRLSIYNVLNGAERCERSEKQPRLNCMVKVIYRIARERKLDVARQGADDKSGKRGAAVHGGKP